MNNIELWNMISKMSVEELKNIIDSDCEYCNEKELEVVKDSKNLIDKVSELTDQERERTAKITLAYMIYKERQLK